MRHVLIAFQHYLSIKNRLKSALDRRIGGWRARLAIHTAAFGLFTILGLVRFAFSLALELVFFFTFFGELFLAFFVGVIGSGH